MMTLTLSPTLPLIQMILINHPLLHPSIGLTAVLFVSSAVIFHIMLLPTTLFMAPLMLGHPLLPVILTPFDLVVILIFNHLPQHLQQHPLLLVVLILLTLLLILRRPSSKILLSFLHLKMILNGIIINIISMHIKEITEGMVAFVVD